MILTEAQNRTIDGLMDEFPKDDFTLLLIRGHSFGDTVEVKRSWFVYGGEHEEWYTIDSLGRCS